MTREDQHTEERRSLPSAEVEEIMGQVPPAMLRYGIAVILALMGVVLALAWFIQYPDRVSGTTVISSENPPLPVVCRVDERISSLTVADSEMVKVGQVLAVLGTAGDPEMVQHWKAHLIHLQNALLPDSLYLLAGMGAPPDPGVPALAPAAGELAARWQTWQHLLEKRSRYDQERMDALHRRIVEQEDLVRSLRNQLRLLKEESQLVSRDYRRDSVLALSGAIPPIELEGARGRVLRHAMNVEDLRTRMAEVVIRKGEYEQELSDFLSQTEQGMQESMHQLGQAVGQAKGALAEWERTNLLRSPAEGRVSLARDWMPGQEVNAGAVLLHVLPSETGEMMARISLPVRGSGLVAPGAGVRIRLDDFPAMEYGMLEGVIVRVSAIPQEAHLQVDARLTAGLQTTYGTDLPFRGTLLGRAEVTTRSARLLERVIRPLRYLLRHQTSESTNLASPQTKDTNR